MTKSPKKFNRMIPKNRRVQKGYSPRMMQTTRSITDSRVRRLESDVGEASSSFDELLANHSVYHIPEHTSETFPRAFKTPVAARVGKVCETRITGRPFSFEHFQEFFAKLYGQRVEPVWLRFVVSTKKHPDGRLFRAAVSFGCIKNTRLLRIVELIYQNGRPMCQLRAIHPQLLIGDVDVLHSDMISGLPVFS